MSVHTACMKNIMRYFLSPISRVSHDAKNTSICVRNKNVTGVSVVFPKRTK